MERTVWVNGERCPDGKASIDVDDEGFTLGRSVFETLRTYQGRIFALEEHIDRISASANAMQILLPDPSRLEQELMRCAENHGLQLDDVAIRLTLTSGGVRVVRVAKIPEKPRTMRCVTRRFVPPDWLDGTVKHCSRAYSRMAVMSADADEVLWVDADDHLLEGTRSNVFAILEGKLCTPPVDGRFLAGVTRSAVLEAASVAGMPVSMAPLPASRSYDGLFICSTLKEIVPVNSIDGRTLPIEKTWSAVLAEAFQAVVMESLT